MARVLRSRTGPPRSYNRSVGGAATRVSGLGLHGRTSPAYTAEPAARPVHPEPRRVRLADKLTPLLLDALRRATLAPGGTPLVGTKAAPGLFPASAVARQAARRAFDDGLLAVVAPDPGGKPDRDLAAATDKGRAFLIEQTSPRQVLEDLVRAVEARHEQVGGLIAAARQVQASLDAIKEVVAELQPAIPSPAPAAAP